MTKLLERKESLCLMGGRESFRMLHLSDLHIKYSTRRLAWLLQLAERGRPDLVVMTGDYFDLPAGARHVRNFLLALAPRVPIVFITGNHDHWYGAQVAALLQGIERCVCIDGTTYTVRSPRGFCYRFHAWSQRAQAQRGANVVNIGLVHNPAVVAGAELFGLDMILAGHLHGGQFVAFKSPRTTHHYPGRLFYRYCSDRVALTPACTLIVSRGLGDTLPLRFNCPHEAIHVEVC